MVAGAARQPHWPLRRRSVRAARRRPCDADGSNRRCSAPPTRIQGRPGGRRTMRPEAALGRRDRARLPTFAPAPSVRVFAMRQPVDLVSPDYYQRALDHDRHQAARARGLALGDALRIDDDAQTGSVTVTWPEAGDPAGTWRGHVLPAIEPGLGSTCRRRPRPRRPPDVRSPRIRAGARPLDPAVVVGRAGR